MTGNYRTVATALVVLAGVLSACGQQGSDGALPAESAEDHSGHVHGGMSGATDSTGAAVRQPIRLSAAEERALGVTYTEVRREPFQRTIRTVGRIEIPEPNLAEITTRVDGFVERLLVNTTGQTVRRGEPVLELYSPALVAAQEELQTARRLLDRIHPSDGTAREQAEAVLEAARRRLEYWDVAPDQIRAFEDSGAVSRVVTLLSPAAGIVLEKDVVEGQQVRAGQRLFRVADLSEVWVEGDVFEQDLQFVSQGAQAHIEVSAYPGVHLMGRVSFVYPTVDEETRTNRVRVTVPNRDFTLKPGMFATIYFDATLGEQVLAVPLDAVVITGERNIVFVHGDDGSLVPREVVLGARSGDRVEILQGLSEGETVVASANFMVDAESRLGVTGGSMPGMQHEGHGSALEPGEMEADTSGGGHSGHDPSSHGGLPNSGDSKERHHD